MCKQGTNSHRRLWASPVDTVLTGFGGISKRNVSKLNVMGLHGKGSMALVVPIVFNCQNLLFSRVLAKCRRLNIPHLRGLILYSPIQ